MHADTEDGRQGLGEFLEISISILAHTVSPTIPPSTLLGSSEASTYFMGPSTFEQRIS